MDAPVVIAAPKADVQFDPTGRVEVAFVASHARGEALRATARLVPVGGTDGWATLIGEPERTIAPGARETYAARVVVPPADWSPRRAYRHAFRLELVDARGAVLASSPPVTARAAGRRLPPLGAIVLVVVAVLGFSWQIWWQISSREVGMVATSGRKLADYGAEIDLDLDQPDGVGDIRLEDPVTTQPGSTGPFVVPTRSLVPTPPGIRPPPTVSIYDFVPAIVVVTALNNAEISRSGTSLGLRTCRGQLRAGKDSTVASGGRTLCVRTSRGTIIEFGVKEVDPSTAVITYAIYRQWLYLP